MESGVNGLNVGDFVVIRRGRFVGVVLFHVYLSVWGNGTLRV